MFTWLRTALVIITLLCSACRGGPIKVGFMGPLTGPYADLGVYGRNGARLAVEDINSRGGIAGRKLLLLVRDDEGTPDGAVKAYRSLARDGVVALIGPMTSEQAMAVTEIAPSVGVPLISPTVSTPLLSGKKDLFFRIQSETDKAGIVLARIVASQPLISNVCVVKDIRNKAYTEPIEKAFVSEYTRLQGRMVCKLAFDPENTGFIDSLAEEVRRHNPDALVIIASANVTGRIVERLAPEHPRLRFFVLGWAQTEELIARAGVAAERILLLADNMPVDSTAALRKFAWQYKSRYGIAPAFPAVRAYDAVSLLAEALGECGGHFDNLKTCLSTPRVFRGLSGKLVINEYGDASGDFYLVSVRNGRFKLLNRIKATGL